MPTHWEEVEQWATAAGIIEGEPSRRRKFRRRFTAVGVVWSDHVTDHVTGARDRVVDTATSIRFRSEEDRVGETDV